MGRASNKKNQQRFAGKAERAVSAEDTSDFPGIAINDLPDIRLHGYRGLITASGRLISEWAASPHAIALATKRVNMTRRQSENPFPRLGLLENRAAYEDMKSRWREDLGSLVWLNHLFFNNAPPAQVTVEQAHRLAMLARSAVGYAVMRVENPYEGTPGNPVPDSVGDVHKIGRGIVAETRWFRQIGPQHFVTPDEIYLAATSTIEENRLRYKNWTEKKIMLSNLSEVDRTRRYIIEGEKNNYTCPASEESIIKAMEALFYGMHGNPANSHFDSYFPNRASLLKFGTYMTEVQDTIDGRLSQYANIKTPAFPPARKSEREKVRRQVEDQKHTIEKNYLNNMTKLQNNMNILLGRSITIKPYQ